MSKKLLIIAAVAVMLAGATNASAYTEVWNGWFNSGHLTLTLDGVQTFDYVEGEGTLDDTTYGSVDSFAIYAIFVLTFACTETYDTIKLWAAPASGSKETGQSGQKEVDEGEWVGYAILIILQPPDPPRIEEYDVEGTWNTRDDGDHFDYTDCPCPPATPTYSAEWIASESDPPGLGGKGGSAGDRVLYEE